MTGRLVATGSQEPVALIVVILTRAAAIAAPTATTTIIATRAATTAAAKGALRLGRGCRRGIEIDATPDLDTFATLTNLTRDGRACGRILQTGDFQR